MSADAAFKAALERLFENEEIGAVFESGTFDGSGSTTTLAEAVKGSGKKLNGFFTAEADYKLYKKAKRNLAPYPFVTPLWGLTVRFDEAKQFVEEDEAIKKHEYYPEIFIDDVDDPQGFYLNELRGQLSKHHIRQSVLQKLRALFEKRNDVFEEDLFRKYLPAQAAQQPLILLDSAGGIGFLEFNLVKELMKNATYFLILDDIHHLKHFRSYRAIKENPRFAVIEENQMHGWVIAKYKA